MISPSSCHVLFCFLFNVTLSTPGVPWGPCTPSQEPGEHTAWLLEQPINCPLPPVSCGTRASCPGWERETQVRHHPFPQPCSPKGIATPIPDKREPELVVGERLTFTGSPSRRPGVLPVKKNKDRDGYGHAPLWDAMGCECRFWSSSCWCPGLVVDRAGTLGDGGVGSQELVLRWGQWVEPLMSRGSELSARAPIPHQTSLIKRKFKDEIKNFKMVTTEH